jgi:hypothetical protein
MISGIIQAAAVISRDLHLLKNGDEAGEVGLQGQK